MINKIQLNDFSIVTNACPTDDIRIIPVIKSWLRVFGPQLKKILIIFDSQNPVGRIASLHNNSGSYDGALAALKILANYDSRIEVVQLPEQKYSKEITKGWFSDDYIPHRCQAGTPILPFIYGMAKINNDIVLRVDCDMVFHDKRLVDKALSFLSSNQFDIIEPFRWTLKNEQDVSTRAFFFSPNRFKIKCLPLQHKKLDFLRYIHRAIKGLPKILALENTLNKEKNSGKIKHLIMEQSDGWSLHLGKRSDFLINNIEEIILKIENGILPEKQLNNGNFDPTAWI